MDGNELIGDEWSLIIDDSESLLCCSGIALLTASIKSQFAESRNVKALATSSIPVTA